jgi:hypothetical protein
LEETSSGDPARLQMFCYGRMLGHGARLPADELSRSLSRNILAKRSRVREVQKTAGTVEEADGRAMSLNNVRINALRAR